MPIRINIMSMDRGLNGRDTFRSLQTNLSAVSIVSQVDVHKRMEIYIQDNGITIKVVFAGYFRLIPLTRDIDSAHSDLSPGITLLLAVSKDPSIVARVVSDFPRPIVSANISPYVGSGKSSGLDPVIYCNN